MDNKAHELMTERVKKSYERGIINAEQAYRVSAEEHLQKGDKEKFEACCKAADLESEKETSDGCNS